MNFHYSQDQQMLANMLGRYLKQRYPNPAERTIDAASASSVSEHWAALAELGVIGALFGENVGGFGGSGLEISVVFEQLGGALVTEPFLPTLMAGRVLANAGGHEALLENIIAGGSIITFAHEEPESRYTTDQMTTRAELSGADWLLTGRKSVVPHLGCADHVVVSARIGDLAKGHGALALFLVDKNASNPVVQDYSLVEGGAAGELVLNATPATMLLETGTDLIEDCTAAGIVALCWEALGAMDRIKADTLEYLGTRKQFGAPLGSFQALRHRVANMTLEIEQARSAAINAAAALGADRIERERTASAAKFTIDRTSTLVAEEAIQLHGGIGMTWELPLSHYAKRLIMIGHQLGDEDHHLARYILLGRAA